MKTTNIYAFRLKPGLVEDARLFFNIGYLIEGYLELRCGEARLDLEFDPRVYKFEAFERVAHRHCKRGTIEIFKTFLEYEARELARELNRRHGDDFFWSWKPIQSDESFVLEATRKKITWRG